MGKRAKFPVTVAAWLVLVAMLLFGRARQAEAGRTQTVSLLSMVVLAFDNPHTSPSNLTPQYSETLDALIAASTGQPDQVIVVLADLDADGDTHIITLANGSATYVDGLPNIDGTLDAALTEYDMGDGATLGQFMRWARSSYPATRSALLYYGHGAPLIPETDAPTARATDPVPLPSWVTALPSWVTALPSWVTALPSWVTANPDLTDVHPLSLLSVHDLGVALALATDNGANPLDVVDLVHCFSLTLEQATEIAPYTQTIAGSANYAFYTADMPAAAVRALGSENVPAKMARGVIEAYDSTLPADGYPRIMTALISAKLPPVRAAFDAVAAALIDGLAVDAANTRERLVAAYLNSAKYDTTYCAGDWQLAGPDALSDARAFAVALRQQFGANSAVGQQAHLAGVRLKNAVYATVARSGQPAFLNLTDAPTWTFDGVGLGIYTDFVGRPDSDGKTYLSWQAAYYDGNVAAHNPAPYAFLRGAQPGWDELFAAFWDGTPIDVELCLRTFPQPVEPGEVSATAWISPRPGSAQVGSDVQPGINLTTASELRNLHVRFNIEQGGSVVLSTTVATGYLITGTHTVAADALWTPTQTGTFTLTATVDARDVVSEQNETDNVLARSDSVQPASGRAATSAAPAAVYQFPFDGNATHFAAQLIGWSATAPDGTLHLPAGVRPGVAQLRYPAVGAVMPVVDYLNVNPAASTIARGGWACYLLSVAATDSVQLLLEVTAGDANLFVWYPLRYGSPDLVGTRRGNDALLANRLPRDGVLQSCVYGVSDATYTLTVHHNAPPIDGDRGTPNPQAFVPQQRPVLADALAPAAPLVPTAVALAHAGDAASRSAGAPIVLLALLLAALSLPLIYKRIWNRF